MPASDPHDLGLVFAPERAPSPDGPAPWTVMIVDDDAAVHEVTRLALADFEFDGRGLRFLSAYSAASAVALLREHADIALVLLDVVMESDTAGLGLIATIREALGNRWTRIVLRTGQPGQAPERRVIVEFDISDYKTKVELTAGKLFTSVVAALRTYRHLRETEARALALRRFFPEEFTRLLGREDIAAVRLGDHVERAMTVMSAELCGSAGRAEAPADRFAAVNATLTATGPLVRAQGGFIDKFLADGFLALFPGGAGDAVRAAVQIQRRLAGLPAGEGGAPRLAIGLHSGQVSVGTVGEPERMDVTVLSGDVDLAAQIGAMGQRYRASVLLSEQTLAQLRRGDWETRAVGHVAGPTARVAVYELLDADSEATQATRRETAADFAAGLRCHESNRHAEACVHLREVLRRDPCDEAARLLLRLSAEALLASLDAERRPKP